MGHQFDFSNGLFRLKILVFILAHCMTFREQGFAVLGRDECLACVDKSRMCCQDKGTNIFKTVFFQRMKEEECLQC